MGYKWGVCARARCWRSKAAGRLGKALGGGSARGCLLVPSALREFPPRPGSPPCISTFSIANQRADNRGRKPQGWSARG